MQLISEKQVSFLEEWFTPKAFIETLFANFDNPGIFDKKNFGEIRVYQEPFISDESLIDFDLTAKHHNLTKKEAFKLRKNVGDIYLFGGRRFGKSLCSQKLDLLNSMVHTTNTPAAFGSVDLIHINQILDNVKIAFQSHPLLKPFVRNIKGAPNYNFKLKNNYHLQSVNFNIGSKQPGQQFVGKHCDIIYLEEESLETEEVYRKRLDSIGELGAIIRASGMTNFTAYSPAGKMFYNKENKKHVINYPQFVNPLWDEEEKQNRLEHFGGEDALEYRIFVKGEIVENSVTVFDMSRLREACYLTKRQIKRFEITKERYPYFRNTLVTPRPKNAERIFIDADIGKHVTEIIVHSEIADKYYYLYNIVLYELTISEKQKIFDFIIKQLEANVIGLDCGDGEGRALFNYLEKKYPKDNLVYYDGSMKIEVDFELDGNKEIKIEKGKPVYKTEFMSEFSVQRLKVLGYAGRLKIPEDYKFDAQFSVVMAMISGTRTKYKCASQSGDHLFDAHKVFSIAQWLKKDFNKTKPITTQDWGIGVMN